MPTVQGASDGVRQPLPTPTAKRKQPHVLVVGIAFRGHFGPFVQILYHLAARYTRVTVTVMGNKDRIEELKDLQSKGDFQPLDLRLEEVFGPVPVYALDPKFPVRSALTSEANFRECESLRRSLVDQKAAGNGGPTVVISDQFQYWAKDLADELGVPWYTYWSTCAPFAVAAMQLHSLIKDGALPMTSRNDLLTDYPGLTFVRTQDLADELYVFRDFYEKVVDRTLRATAVLLNTSEELDSAGASARALTELLRSSRVLTVGPAVQFPGYGYVYSPPTESSAYCLEWLDSQRKESVLYIAFGSLGAVSKEAILDLAFGVEASGVPFLWALNAGSWNISEVLPSGFMERTSGRGIIETRWVPQCRILAHSSTGGFLSHSGWNSTLESIVAGVPLISWPLSADQPMSARFIADVAKVGLLISHLKAENRYSCDQISRDEVEKAVRMLMLEEKGRELRSNAAQLQKSVAASVAEGGSSYRNLHSFLDEITS